MATIASPASTCSASLRAESGRCVARSSTPSAPAVLVTMCETGCASVVTSAPSDSAVMARMLRPRSGLPGSWSPTGSPDHGVSISLRLRSEAASSIAARAILDEVERGGDAHDLIEARRTDRPVRHGDERIALRRVELDRHDRAGVLERAARGRLDRRRAAEVQRVLEVPRRTLAPQVAPAEQLAEPRQRTREHRVGPRPLDRRVQHREIGGEALQAERRRHVGGIEEPARRRPAPAPPTRCRRRSS